MPLIEQLLSGSRLEAIAAMLFHSLWQGTVLAAAAGVVLLLTRESAAALRYRFLVTLVIIFAAGVAYTYWLYLPGDIVEIKETAGNAAATEPRPDGRRISSGHLVSDVANFFRANSGIVVFCWLTLTFIRLCLLATGYRKVQRFRKKNLIHPSEEWKQRWTTLIERMNITMQVKLMESALAKVPMVIGHFRPLVLVPAGMLMSLPPSEAEAILLHELAHIRRRDYLFNLIQQGLECIFFFHPAVLWVCSLIAEEREHCCDDMAASHNTDKRIYINALVSFYEHSLPPAAAASFAGRKHSMVHRIKRLINHRNKTLNIMEKIFLTIALVIAGFMVHAYYVGKSNVRPYIMQNVTDTLPKNNEDKVVIQWTENGTSYKAIFKNEKLDEFYANGKKIPPQEYSAHQEVIDRMYGKKREAERDAAQAIKDAERAKEDAKRAQEEARREAERAKREIEEHVEARERGQREIILNEREINEIVENARKDAEEALQELREEGFTDEQAKEHLRSALEKAQQGIRMAEKQLRAAELNHDRHENFENEQRLEKELAAISAEAVQLGLKAAQIGLHEAEAQLRVIHRENRVEKMDKKEYRERKRHLREEYRNSQRSREN